MENNLQKYVRIFKCIIFDLDGTYTPRINNKFDLYLFRRNCLVIMFHCSRRGTFNYLESHVCNGTRLTGDSTIEQGA